MYLPGGHLVWAVQESVSVLVIDVAALKNPVAHGSHWGCVLGEPAILVYLPGWHLVCSVQGLVDVTILKNPATHGWHELVFFAPFLYVPGGHSVSVASGIEQVISVTSTRRIAVL